MEFSSLNVAILVCEDDFSREYTLSGESGGFIGVEKVIRLFCRPDKGADELGLLPLFGLPALFLVLELELVLALVLVLSVDAVLEETEKERGLSEKSSDGGRFFPAFGLLGPMKLTLLAAWPAVPPAVPALLLL